MEGHPIGRVEKIVQLLEAVARGRLDAQTALEECVFSPAASGYLGRDADTPQSNIVEVLQSTARSGGSGSQPGSGLAAARPAGGGLRIMVGARGKR